MRKINGGISNIVIFGFYFCVFSFIGMLLYFFTTNNLHLHVFVESIWFLLIIILIMGGFALYGFLGERFIPIILLGVLMTFSSGILPISLNRTNYTYGNENIVHLKNQYVTDFNLSDGSEGYKVSSDNFPDGFVLKKDLNENGEYINGAEILFNQEDLTYENIVKNINDKHIEKDAK